MQKITSRVHAAAIHLAISVLIASVLAAFLYFVLYPWPLFRIMGSMEIFGILLLVDVVLGPLLTLIVFNRSKKSLKFDLFAIAAVQTLALAYGMYTLYVGRPVYVASLGHRFEIIQASEIPADELKRFGASLPKFGPVWVGTKISDDPKESDRILNSALGGIDYGHYPQHHIPLTDMSKEILKNAQTSEELLRLVPARATEIQSWFKQKNLDMSKHVFLGLRGKTEDFTVVLDRNAKVVAVAPFSPWP
jgi:hypothetical protein